MFQHWVITLKNQIKKYMIIHNVVNFGYALLPPRSSLWSNCATW